LLSDNLRMTCSRCGAEVPAGARFCPACAAPVEEERPRGERKLATVLFADLVGSTALGDAQDPERTRALLERFYDAMSEEVEQAGGTVEKFAGDAVMAAFGAPTALEDHAERALHAALAMQHRLRELFDDRLELRIGVNTGEVVVGRPREGSSFVTGDAVNVAARLEQAAEPGTIFVGERTVAAARGAFEFEEPTEVEAKGKPDGITARRLVRALSLMRPRGVSGLAHAFVGREREVGRLTGAYRAAVEQRRPRLVTIVGDAGVGKTRLVRELWQSLSQQQPAPVRRTGRCLSYGAGITYHALGEVLKEHLGLLESDPPELALARLEGHEILGLALGLDVVPDLHPLAARDRFQDAWAEFLTDVVTERPGVVLIEDVHWAEEQLLDLLEHLLTGVDGPLLVIATARPELLERRPGWSVRAGGELLELEPLNPEDSVRMLDELLTGELPPEVASVVVDRAEGNPFFVEELVGVLIDRGLLARRNGGWALSELPAEFTVPDSIHAVLAARIDLLGAAEKSALQAAAVMGRVFWAGPVYELAEGEPDLRILEERDLVRRRSGSSMAGEREYAIKHALTREVAYASLPKAQRARMHAAFAEWLERLGVARDDFASFLAHHYAEAVRPEDVDLAWAGEDAELARLREKAAVWLERAAELAIRRYELDDALSLLHRALALESDQEAQGRLWRAAGTANALKFDGEAFWAAMQNALDLSSSDVMRAETYSELAFQTAIRSGMWPQRPDPRRVLGWIDRALELAGPESVSRARALIARCFWERSDADAAEEANEIAERSGDVELRSRALGAKSVVAFAKGDFERSFSWARLQLEGMAGITDPDHLCDIYELAIPPTCAVGRLDDARRLAIEHDAIAEPLSAHHRVHGVAVLLEVEEICGGWDLIRELGDRTVAAVEANLATPCIRNARSLLLTALAAAYAGDDETARHYELRAEEIASEGYDFVLAAPRTWLALHRGVPDDAPALTDELDFWRAQTWFALQTAAARLDALAAVKDRSAVEREAPQQLRPGTYLEPFALRALGVVREEEQLIVQAIAGFAAMGLAWHADESRKLLAPA
jgi:class 3 adenylate cyclase